MGFTDAEWALYLKTQQKKFKGNKDHLRFLLENGVKGWNELRHKNIALIPNLTGVDLSIKINPVKIPALKSILVGSGLLNGNEFSGNLFFDLSHINLADAIMEESDLTNCVLNHARFQRANLKSANLEKASFRKAFLLETDLRDADFFWTDFTEAGLNRAKIQGASLVYTDFTRTVVTGIRYTKAFKIFGKTLINSGDLKDFHGANVDSCKGDQVFRRYVMDQDYLKTKRHSEPSWFYKPLFFVWGMTCYYGQSMLLWIFWSVFLAVFFAGVFYSLGSDAFYINPEGVKDFSFFSVLYYSIVTFTTLGFGDVIPKTTCAAFWVIVEVITGYTMLGGLISIFATKLARRS